MHRTRSSWSKNCIFSKHGRTSVIISRSRPEFGHLLAGLWSTFWYSKSGQTFMGKLSIWIVDCWLLFLHFLQKIFGACLSLRRRNSRVRHNAFRARYVKINTVITWAHYSVTSHKVKESPLLRKLSWNQPDSQRAIVSQRRQLILLQINCWNSWNLKWITLSIAQVMSPKFVKCWIFKTYIPFFYKFKENLVKKWSCKMSTIQGGRNPPLWKYSFILIFLKIWLSFSKETFVILLYIKLILKNTENQIPYLMAGYMVL